MDEVNQHPTKNKKILLLLLGLSLIILAAIAWYFVTQTKSSPSPKYTIQKIATDSSQEATPSASSGSELTDLELIKKALVAKTGISIEMIDVSITKPADNFVKGLVGTKGEETGGGYFLAVKDKGNWYIVYDGQATPNCVAVNPFNFPADMVSECLDASGNLVKR